MSSEFLDWLCDQYLEPSESPAPEPQEENWEARRAGILNRVQSWLNAASEEWSEEYKAQVAHALNERREGQRREEALTKAFKWVTAIHFHSANEMDAASQERREILEDLLAEFEWQCRHKGDTSDEERIRSAFGVALERRMQSVQPSYVEFLDSLVQYYEILDQQTRAPNALADDQDAEELVLDYTQILSLYGEQSDGLAQPLTEVRDRVSRIIKDMETSLSSSDRTSIAAEVAKLNESQREESLIGGALWRAMGIQARAERKPGERFMIRTDLGQEFQERLMRELNDRRQLRGTTEVTDDLLEDSFWTAKVAQTRAAGKDEMEIKREQAFFRNFLSEFRRGESLDKLTRGNPVSVAPPTDDATKRDRRAVRYSPKTVEFPHPPMALDTLPPNFEGRILNITQTTLIVGPYGGSHKMWEIPASPATLQPLRELTGEKKVSVHNDGKGTNAENYTIQPGHVFTKSARSSGHSLSKK